MYSAALPPELEEMRVVVEEYARAEKLDYPEVRFVMLDFDQINQVAAYDGFPSRYPHWRFGMECERLRKSYAYGLHRIYEMVVNTDPCYAYLLVSNLPIDQKLVMAHVYGHADFFKNNYWFAHTNRRMMDDSANHGTRVRRYVDRFGLDAVETFIDRCLSLDNLIDLHSVAIRRQPTRPVDMPNEEDDHPARMPSKDYMDEYINPPEFMEAQRKQRKKEHEQSKQFPSSPQRDVLLFLLENAPLEPWQQDVLAIIREEAYYFAPQRQTKIMNEGWACAVGDTLVSTNLGLLRIDELVNRRLEVRVSDGSAPQRVYDWAKFENRPTIRMTTRRGFVLEGSVTHRVRVASSANNSTGEPTWKRLDELQIGDQIDVAQPVDLWPTQLQPISWAQRQRTTLQDVADQVGVNLSTVIRHKMGTVVSRKAEALTMALTTYQEEFNTMPVMQNKRVEIRVPAYLDSDFAAFLGYLIGDGHVSLTKREVGLTSGDDEQADRFVQLGQQLFGAKPSRWRDENRWRTIIYSQNLIDLLLSLGLTEGPSAAQKSIPADILRSPKAVVGAFLRAYFDCDGYAGKQGVILSTMSDRLSEQTQIMLLQFGILSRRRKQQDGCWHVHITGTSAQVFANEIGFGLKRKQVELHNYLSGRQWFKAETWTDEVASLQTGQATVYDMSVENTHCYAANGMINHNSYWHTHIMTNHAMHPSELIDYADHHSGTVATSPGRLNPYKLGIELFRDIEERWNRGAFGAEYEDCQDLRTRAKWDKQLGLGREKIFEVRRIYNDIGFIDEFLTPEFAQRQNMFSFRYNRHEEQYEIESRQFQDIKRQLLYQLTNFGEPIIEITDANYQNRGDLYLMHRWDSVDLRFDYAQATLENVHALWRRPVHLETMVTDKGGVIFSFDGKQHTHRLMQKQTA